MADDIVLTQDELNQVLNGVRSDNKKNEKHITGQTTAAISQAELDNLFSNHSTPVQKVENVGVNDFVQNSESEISEASVENPVNGDSEIHGDSKVQELQDNGKAESESSLAVEIPAPASSANLTLAEKIRNRKERMEALLAKVNSRSPKRITVVYGSTLTTGGDIENYKPGTTIELDRDMGTAVDILCDGKLIARGFAGKLNGKAAVQITQMVD